MSRTRTPIISNYRLSNACSIDDSKSGISMMNGLNFPATSCPETTKHRKHVLLARGRHEPTRGAQSWAEPKPLVLTTTSNEEQGASNFHCRNPHTSPLKIVHTEQQSLRGRGFVPQRAILVQTSNPSTLAAAVLAIQSRRRDWEKRQSRGCGGG